MIYIAASKPEVVADVVGQKSGAIQPRSSEIPERCDGCRMGHRRADDALIEGTKLLDGICSATIVHAKDDAHGDRFGFKLDRAELGTDNDGDPITTLTVTEVTDTALQAKPTPKLSNNEQIALQCLDKSISVEGVPATVGDNSEERKVTTSSCWRAWFYRSGMPGETADTRLKAFNRPRDGLVSKQRVVAQDDYVWRPKGW